MLYIEQGKDFFFDYIIVNEKSADTVKHLMYSPDECKKIIELSKYYESSDGKIIGGKLDLDFRKVTRWKLPNDDNTNWIYDRVCKSFLAANSSFWNFDIDFIEDLELIRYQYDPNSQIQDHYNKHSDFGGKIIKRKISYSAQLSTPEEYEGSDLILYLEKDLIVPKDQGQIIMFPSFVLHRVTEITKGTRWSLVAWISGRPFR